jgi:hypothetical protein
VEDSKGVGLGDRGTPDKHNSENQGSRFQPASSRLNMAYFMVFLSSRPSYRPGDKLATLLRYSGKTVEVRSMTRMYRALALPSVADYLSARGLSQQGNWQKNGGKLG